MPWKGERLPTPAFWPGEFHGLYSPRGCKESDTTERLFTFTSQRTVHLLLGPVSHCTPSKHCHSASPQLTRISQTGAYAAAPRFWLQPGDTLNLLGTGSQWRVHGPTYGIYLHTLKATAWGSRFQVAWIYMLTEILPFEILTGLHTASTTGSH